jgi:hypothetical protein
MSHKSSVPQVAKSVSQALIPDKLHVSGDGLRGMLDGPSFRPLNAKAPGSPGRQKAEGFLLLLGERGSAISLARSTEIEKGRRRHGPPGEARRVNTAL